MLQFASQKRSPPLCTTNAFILSSQPSLWLSISVKALPANSQVSGSSQFSKVNYQQLLSVYQFLEITFLPDCSYLRGIPCSFFWQETLLAQSCSFRTWNATFPLPVGRLWCTHWALISNASKHSPWKCSYFPSYMVHFSGRLHGYCLCPETPPWGTGNALLMWTRPMISLSIYFISEQNGTHMYIW